MNNRQKDLIHLLETRKKMTVHELSTLLYASEPTIRRDLLYLEQNDYLIRNHGGAEIRYHEKHNVPDAWNTSSSGFIQSHSAEEIDRMAKIAESLLHDGDVVMLDSSFPIYAVTDYFKNKKGLVVLTNSLHTAVKLVEMGVKTYVLGGYLNMERKSTIGYDSRAMIERYTADIAFVSCAGMTIDGKVTEFSIDENDVRMAMLKNSKKNVLVTDNKRVGRQFMLTVGNLQDFDYVICDAPLPSNLQALRNEYDKTPELY